MQQSLNVLSTADDYEDKKMELEGLKNRLEANVSPHIVKAFTTSNFGNCYFQICHVGVNRENQFRVAP